jgi:lysophospholipase L1-like esterase
MNIRLAMAAVVLLIATTVGLGAMAASQRSDERPMLLVLGDSIAVGCCADRHEYWTNQLARHLDAKAVNVAISGASSDDVITEVREWPSGRRHSQLAEGVSLLVEAEDVAAITLTVGLNDILPFYNAERDALCLQQGGAICDRAVAGAEEDLRRNLDAILTFLNETKPPGTPVVMMTLWWGECDRGLNAVLRETAREHGALVVPACERFRGRAGELLAPDGIHPNAAGHRVIADAVMEALEGGRP